MRGWREEGRRRKGVFISRFIEENPRIYFVYIYIKFKNLYINFEIFFIKNACGGYVLWGEGLAHPPPVYLAGRYAGILGPHKTAFIKVYLDKP